MKASRLSNVIKYHTGSMKVFQISFRIFVVQKAKLYQNKIDKGINIAIFSICPAKMLS